MPIDDIKPSDALHPYVGNEQEQNKHRPGYGGFKGKHKYPSPKRGLNDVTSFMGIPEAELTPAVTDAIISLMEEVDDLRSQLAHAHGHENIMAATADSHAELPVLTRHALVRELGVMSAHAERTGSPCTFVYFQIKNMQHIKDRLGLLACEMALRGSSELLIGELRLTDRIGTLGGDGFGIVLTLAEKVAALEKVKELVSKVEQGTVLWDGQRLDIQIAYGLHAVHPNEITSVVLNEADKDLHRRFQNIKI